MKHKTILLTRENAEVALDKLVLKKLAERQGGTKWRLTYRGQTQGLRIWGMLADSAKMLLIGMLEDLDAISK